MKKALILLGLLALTGSALATTVTVFEEDFEGLPAGDIRNQGYTPYVQANVAEFVCDITNHSPYAGSKCLHVRKIKGSSSQRGGVWIPLTGMSSYIGQDGCFTLTYMVRTKANLASVGLGDCTSDVDSYVDIMQTFWRINGGNADFKDSQDKTVVNYPHNSAWSEVRYVIDSKTGAIWKYSVAGVDVPEVVGVVLDLDRSCYLCPGVFEPPYGANKRDGLTLDNIKLTWTDEPIIDVLGGGMANYNEDGSVVTTLNNFGATDTVNFEILQGSPWFSYQGEGGGSVTLNKGDSVDVTFTADHATLGKQCGFARVRYSWTGGYADVDYRIQSGTKGAGWCLFSSAFDKMTLGSSILDYMGWVAAGTIDTCVVAADPVNPANQCLSIKKCQALHTTVNVPAGCSELYDVKISARLYFDSTAAKKDVILGTNISPAEQRQGEYRLQMKDDGIHFQIDNCASESKTLVTNVAPYDQWFDVSYSFNTAVDGRVLRFVDFDGQHYEANVPLTLDEGQGLVDNFIEFRNYTMGSTKYYVDDFNVELIKKGTVPEPALCGLLALAALFLRRK